MDNSTMTTYGELSGVCGLLSTMYLCKPDRDTLEEWKMLLSEDIPDFLSGLRDAVNEIELNSEDVLEALLWDYTRLFIGPYKMQCPPWESVYTSPKRLMVQASHDEVHNFYNEAGLAINTPDVMPDHIGAELNFLALLLQDTCVGPEKGQNFQALAKRFLDEHLMRWIPQFADDMENAADTLLYRTLARVTRELIASISEQGTIDA
ncbi:MAG: molecular chaperone TorD family protein [Nitrospirae bacterium]|nr:molecular chaperone TorD family protein [Nitrospirota bacterium]